MIKSTLIVLVAKLPPDFAAFNTKPPPEDQSKQKVREPVERKWLTIQHLWHGADAESQEPKQVIQTIICCHCKEKTTYHNAGITLQKLNHFRSMLTIQTADCFIMQDMKKMINRKGNCRAKSSGIRRRRRRRRRRRKRKSCKKREGAAAHSCSLTKACSKATIALALDSITMSS